MHQAEIKSLYDEKDILNIFVHSHHDMWIHTTRRDPKNWLVGENVRIPNFQGHPLFADLNTQFCKILKEEAALNKISICVPPPIDLCQMECVELIDNIADDSVLTIYRDQMGYIGLKTSHAKYPQLPAGPIVWVSAPRQDKMTMAMIKRNKLFTPVFELTKHVADRFNQPRPEFD